MLKYGALILQPSSTAKYLSVFLDDRLRFMDHSATVLIKLRVQCGMVSKLRHFVPRKLLIRNYQTKIKPAIQYGLLIYGSTS